MAAAIGTLSKEWNGDALPVAGENMAIRTIESDLSPSKAVYGRTVNVGAGSWNQPCSPLRVPWRHPMHDDDESTINLKRFE